MSVLYWYFNPFPVEVIKNQISHTDLFETTQSYTTSISHSTDKLVIIWFFSQCFSCQVRSTDHTVQGNHIRNAYSKGTQLKQHVQSENTRSTCCFGKVSVYLRIPRGIACCVEDSLRGQQKLTFNL